MAESYLQSLVMKMMNKGGSPKDSWSFGQGDEVDESSKLCEFQAPRWFPYHLLWFQDVLAKEKLKKKISSFALWVSAIWERKGKAICFLCISFQKIMKTITKNIWYIFTKRSKIFPSKKALNASTNSPHE